MSSTTCGETGSLCGDPLLAQQELPVPQRRVPGMLSACRSAIAPWTSSLLICEFAVIHRGLVAPGIRFTRWKGTWPVLRVKPTPLFVTAVRSLMLIGRARWTLPIDVFSCTFE